MSYSDSVNKLSILVEKNKDLEKMNHKRKIINPQICEFCLNQTKSYKTKTQKKSLFIEEKYLKVIKKKVS